MANTYSLISNVIVGAGGTSAITFNSIPSTYTDLKLVTSIRRADASNYVNLTFNGSASSYTSVRLIGTNNAVTYGSHPNTTSMYLVLTDGTGNTGNTFGSTEIYIPNYTDSFNKTLNMDTMREDNSLGTNAEMDLIAGIWSNTSAITSISLTLASTTIAQYSTAYLYGIKNS